MGDNRNQAALVLVKPEAIGLPSKPLVSIEELTAAMATAVERRANVVGPRAVLPEIPMGYRVAIRVVGFPTDNMVAASQGAKPSNGIWYEVESGKLALHGPALAQLAAMAGISSVPALSWTREIERWYWRSYQVVRLRDLTGQWRHVAGGRGVDARTDPPGRKLTDERSDKALAQLRLHGEQHAESKAMNRAIRKALALKSSYSREEAALPFVMPCLLWSPDPTDLEARRMIAATELGIVDQVYGPAAGSRQITAAPEVIDVVDVEEDTDDDSDEVPRGQGKAPDARQETRPDPRPDTARRDTGRPPAHPDDDPRFAGGRQGSLVNNEPPAGECEVCGDALERAVLDYSLRTFDGHRYCMNHAPRKVQGGGNGR